MNPIPLEQFQRAQTQHEPSEAAYSETTSRRGTLKKSKTTRIKTTTMSFNSSDVEAYQDENPFPVLKQAYLEYDRNRRKAKMRRAGTYAKAFALKKDKM